MGGDKVGMERRMEGIGHPAQACGSGGRRCESGKRIITAADGKE